MLHTFSCLTSCYFYAYIAAFGIPHVDHILYLIYVIYESIFLISLILNFFVEFKPDGQSFPVRDLAKIALRYLRTSFIMDFIPLIPL